MNNVNVNVTATPIRNSSHVVLNTGAKDKSTQIDMSLDISTKLAGLQQKLIAGQLSPSEVEELDNQITLLIKKLPIELQEQFKTLNQDCEKIVTSSHQQLRTTTDATEHEQITSGALNSIVSSASGVKESMSRLEMNLLLPFSVISMQVLSSSSKVMAEQAKLACDKMEAMTKLIEKLQAMTTLMTSINNVLNSEFSRAKAKAAAEKGFPDPGNENNMTWDDGAKNHGQGKDHLEYDFSNVGGRYIDGNTKWYDVLSFGFSRVGDMAWKAKNNPVIDFLTKNGFAHWENGEGKGDENSHLIIDKKLDYYALTPKQKQEFDNAMSVNNGKSGTNADGKEFNHYDINAPVPSIEVKKFYDENGKQIIGDGITEDARYNGTIVFSIDQIPESLRSCFIPMYDNNIVPRDKDSVTHYAVSKDAITKAFGSMISDYASVMGETPDDFSEKLTGGVTGTIKQLDNISKVMQQKIQYIQQKQAVLAKTPENAKEDGNRKLDMFNNLLRSTSF